MTTPIFDFLQKYSDNSFIRLHMPGHKGKSVLGCENLDITEIHGADSLYSASGIIYESEQNATKLFGTKHTLYSTEGSTQCIKAMLHLALTNRKKNCSNVVLAARNAHKAFVYAAALIGFETAWIAPNNSNSFLSSVITPEMLEKALGGLSSPPAAVYVTSPDYLGNMADINGLSKVCHKYGTMLLVDNAHGAYLKFLPSSMHPIELGADMCVDSAHKTLPVLTGGAYLHIGNTLGKISYDAAKSALSLFGSTSPSYLTLASLDKCNEYIALNLKNRLIDLLSVLANTKLKLAENGWRVLSSDPLRITIRTPDQIRADSLAADLRQKGIECEYADSDYVVFMVTTENTADELERLVAALGSNSFSDYSPIPTLEKLPPRALGIREAIFSDSESVEVENAEGKICADPSVSCPPAVPIVISGEIITPDAIKMFLRYGIKTVRVIKH